MSTGPSSIAESRPAESSASGSSSSGPAAVDSSESERNNSQEPGQEVVVSLLGLQTSYESVRSQLTLLVGNAETVGQTSDTIV